MSKQEKSGRPAIRTAIWSTAVLLCSLVSGCKDAATIWSTESNSPDGRWVAAAHTDQYGGPGTAGILSTVTLRQVKGRQDLLLMKLNESYDGRRDRGNLSTTAKKVRKDITSVFASILYVSSPG
jgi:hypothetical protein